MSFTLKPVMGKELIGRRELIEKVVKELKNKASDTDYAFYGLRRVGKTSILREMEARLKKEKNIVPVYVSLWQIFPFNLKSVLEKIIVESMESYKDKLPLKHKISELMKTSGMVLKKILEELKISIALQEELEFTLGFKLEPKTDYGELFERAFSLPEKLAQETKTKCVLFLDEFPSLVELKNGLALVRALRTIHEKQRNTVFCIAGSIRKYMEAVALSEVSPFYKQFMTREIKPLTQEDIKLLLEINGREYGIKVEEDGLKEIYQYTRGIPFYVQFLGKLAAEKQIKIFNKEQVTKLMGMFLEEEGTILFLEYMKAFSAREQEILKAMGQGAESLGEMVSKTKENPNIISTYLLYLINKGAIEKIERGRYCLTDNMFKEWLKERGN